MSRLRRVALAAGGVVAVAVVVAIPFLGWHARQRPWQDATGWRGLPEADRPVAGELWDLATGEAPKLGWLGHAGMRIEWHGRVIVVDPNLNARCTVSPRLLERVEASSVGKVDVVLVSHAHYDHLDAATLESLAPVGTIVLPTGATMFLSRRAAGDAKLVEVRPEDSLRVGELTVTAVPAAHNGNRFHPLASTIGAVGYVVADGKNAIYVAGDTAARNDFEAIGRRHHPRVAILPIGAFLPKFPVGHYHLSPEEAVSVARRLGVETVVPYHFGTFRLSLDRADVALPRFAAEARHEHLRWVMPQLLSGESVTAAVGSAGGSPGSVAR